MGRWRQDTHGHNWPCCGAPEPPPPRFEGCPLPGAHAGSAESPPALARDGRTERGELGREDGGPRQGPRDAATRESERVSDSWASPSKSPRFRGVQNPQSTCWGGVGDGARGESLTGS